MYKTGGSEDDAELEPGASQAVLLERAKQAMLGQQQPIAKAA